jgi:hypothetical protein
MVAAFQNARKMLTPLLLVTRHPSLVTRHLFSTLSAANTSNK